MTILYTLYNNSYIDIRHIQNKKDVSLYINLTNRCPCACTFCLRQTKEMMKDNSLWLETEPTVQEVINELSRYDLTLFKECVFCGFGEPTERLDDLLTIAAHLKQTCPYLPVRINTNGLANLMYATDITPRLKGIIDIISISLNAPSAKEYLELTRSRFGMASFEGMLDFAVKCKSYVPVVAVTIVDIIGEEKIRQCQEIADQLGLSLRVRPFEE
ncbi:TatD family nuclease-associated radical SAM protein [Beduini massiliensis]|uniref:TatD family nuclease-associated radical SAM protein n=1 Tax=Beduini massiliensis TaxID=1585974 RepID=UPI00059A8887|nr:TatD family nuclease-associated radical SAM protein [Beduini massiliensis]